MAYQKTYEKKQKRIINFANSPLIGKLWMSKNGFKSGSIIPLPELVKLLQKHGIGVNDPVPIYLYMVKNKRKGYPVMAIKMLTTIDPYDVELDYLRYKPVEDPEAGSSEELKDMAPKTDF